MVVEERFFHGVMVVKLDWDCGEGRKTTRTKDDESERRRRRSDQNGRGKNRPHGGKQGLRSKRPALKMKDYSWRMARMFWFLIWSSMPRGGRTSAPWTMAPRTQMLPGSMVIFSGSKTVWLQGSPIMACLAV
jgi:hypothetical protein